MARSRDRRLRVGIMPGKSQRARGEGKIMPGKSQRSRGEGKIMPGKSQRSGGEGKIMPGKSQRSGGEGKIIPGKSQLSRGEGKIIPGKSQRSHGEGKIMPGKSQRSRGDEKAATEFNTSIASIMKDIEILGSSRMTWKEKKELENRKVVALGGKPPKKQRLPLSVAKVPMKRQKAREQRILQENAILRRFGAKFSSSSSLERMEEKHNPERRVLKSTEGVFKNGVLDVKHLLRPDPAVGSSQDGGRTYQGKGKKKGGKKNQRKKGHNNRH